MLNCIDKLSLTSQWHIGQWHHHNFNLLRISLFMLTGDKLLRRSCTIGARSYNKINFSVLKDRSQLASDKATVRRNERECVDSGIHHLHMQQEAKANQQIFSVNFLIASFVTSCNLQFPFLTLRNRRRCRKTTKNACNFHANVWCQSFLIEAFSYQLGIKVSCLGP